MKNSEYDKRNFYSISTIAETYDDFRYKGKSGQYVNTRELSTVGRLMPSHGKVLDIPSGTGRFLKSLEGNGYVRIGSDYSWAMLKHIKESDIHTVRLDAFNPAFGAESFDTVVSLRFLFHYARIDGFIREVYRILKPGGAFICQTYRWSPLAINIPVPFRVGGKVHVHSDKKMADLFKTAGFRVVDQKSIFLFSPFLYKFLPYILIKLVSAIERLIPERFRVDTYWKVIKEN